MPKPPRKDPTAVTTATMTKRKQARRDDTTPPTDLATHTRSGLRKLDPAPLVEQGRKQARDELADVVTAADRLAKVVATAASNVEIKAAEAAKDAWMAVLERASRIVDATDARITRLRPKRDAAMLSLFLIDGKRGVDQAAGLSPTTWYDMRRTALGVRGMGKLTAEDRAELARERGIQYVDDAADVIADVAPKVLILNGYREEAFAAQKRAALHLWTRLGVSEPEIRAVTRRSVDAFWVWRYQEQQKRRRADQAERGKAS